MKSFIKELLVFAAILFVLFLVREAILCSNLPEYIKFCVMTEWERAKWIAGEVRP
jgi:hypothetical protein